MSKASRKKLLVVDDNSALLSSWRRALKMDFEVLTASSFSEALDQFNENPDIALLDIRLDESDVNNQDGVKLLKTFLQSRPDIPVVMTSAYGDVSIAVECMKIGAADFVEKQSKLEEIRQRLLNALVKAQTSKKAKHLEEYIQQKEPVEIIGDSPLIEKIKEIIQVVSQDGYINVLIRGGTGTGKELVASSIYRTGRRYGEPFIAVPVVSFPGSLIESELFGYDAGAFTDAKKRKLGWIEKANGGILFLDEIGDLPLDVQVKMLRFLEERQFTRVGSTDPIKVDVQVVSATHQNLENAVEEGKFREDLYFRLKGVQIFLPALKERSEDIPLLVDYFLKNFRTQGRTRMEGVSSEVIEALKSYSWPGNVRELRMAIERAILFADAHGHERIELSDLPTEILNSSDQQSSKKQITLSENFDINEHLAYIELTYIEEALRKSQGRKKEAWKLLGLNDRFALRRRVNIILQKYPELKKQFSLVSRLFSL